MRDRASRATQQFAGDARNCTPITSKRSCALSHIVENNNVKSSFGNTPPLRWLPYQHSTTIHIEDFASYKACVIRAEE
jgi:hypothetical protein